MLVGRMIEHQLGDDAQPAAVRFAQEAFEIPQRPEGRVHVGVTSDVVAVILPR